MNLPRTLSAVVLASVLSASLVALPATASEPAAIPLARASLPAIVGTAQGVGLLAAQGGASLDPAATRFTATTGAEVPTELLVDMVGLPAGTTLAEAVLQRGPSDGPDGALPAISATDAGGTRTMWGAGDGESPELFVAESGSATLGWSFDRPGTYTVGVSARIVLSSTAPTDPEVESTAPAVDDAAAKVDDPASDTAAADAAGVPAEGSTAQQQSEPILLEATYVIEVSDAGASDGLGDQVKPGSATPALPAEQPLQATAAPPVTVAAAGDVRLANSLDGDRLVQKLIQVADDQSLTELNLAATVLHLPTSEPWPGATEDPGVWESAAPGRGAVYRSTVGDTGANELRLSIDSAVVQPGAIFGDSSFDTAGGSISTRLATVSGDGDASLLVYGVEFSGSSAKGAKPSRWVETSAPGSFLYEAQVPFSLAFEEAGRYCVTIENKATLASDGTVMNTDSVLTVAVGEVDPLVVAPCEQPAPIASVSAQPVPSSTTGTTVLDTGLTLLASTIANQQLSFDVVTLDRGRTTSYDPATVVFSVPTQDAAWPGFDSTDLLWQDIAPVGTKLWRTPGYAPASDASERANALVLAVEAAFVPAGALAPDPNQVIFSLDRVSTPENGYVATYVTGPSGSIEGPESAAVWDSRAGGQRGKLGSSGANPDAGVPFYDERQQSQRSMGTTGFAFSAPGVYCLTVGTSATLADLSTSTDRATLTFAVGIDAWTVEPCEQRDGTDPGTDPIDPVDPGPGHLDPSVTWFDRGHLDLKARVDDAGDFVLASVGDAYGEKPISLNDSVWLANNRYTTFTVPEPNDVQDSTHIGEPGSVYYGFSASPTYVGVALWPGINTQGLPASYYDRAFTWTVHGVSGPGNVVVTSGTKQTGAEYFDSRHLPGSFTTGNSHVHENWAFTAPGVYCINMSVTARPKGQDTNEVASGQLTVAVGDFDLTTVQPCGRDTNTSPPVATHAYGEVSQERTVVTGTPTGSRLTRVEVSLRDGELDVAASVLGELGATRDVTDLDRVVWSFSRAGDSWLHLQEWSALPIDPMQLRGDVSVTLGELSGPGDYFATNTRINDPATATLDTRPGQERNSETVFPGRLARFNQQFTAAGVYCLPFTFRATAADGSPLEVTKTLTVAAGVADPSTVELCSEGGSGTDPGDPETPGTGPIVWDVANRSLTNSGATILNEGHVDIASLVKQGSLTTLIKDDSDASIGPVYRDPTETVLQLRPSAETRVPSQPAFAFLGAAGSTIWQVEETQQEGLLWPGWSTELIADAATTRGVQWTLNDASGPGEFALYQTVLAGPQVLFNTRDGITAADTTPIAKNSHAHGTWAFTAEGTYCLAFTRATTLANGASSSSEFVLAVAVGHVNVRLIDPAACFTEVPGQPSQDDVTPIPERELTESTTGGVSILGGAQGFIPGQLMSAQVGRERAGSWVSLWLHSTPTWLGWAQVGTSGAIQVRLPADATLGGHRLVVKNATGGLIGWDSLAITNATIVPPVPGTPLAGDAQAAVQVPATQCAAGATILSSGHVDLASRIVGGSLESLVGDSTSGAKVYREPSGTILWLKPSSRVSLTDGYGQVGPVGSDVWQVPQTQNADLLWLGWSTEALNAGNTRGPVAWTIDGLSGPGSVKVYQTGSFGGVQSMVFNNGGSYSIPLGVHAHANWAFSAQGIYRMTMTQTATLGNGETSSDTETLTIVVGDVDPASAAGSGSGCGSVSNALLVSDDSDSARLAADQAAAAAAAAARTVLPGQAIDGDTGVTNPFTELSQGNPVPLLMTILGVLLLAGAGGAGVLGWRRRPREARPAIEARS